MYLHPGLVSPSRWGLVPTIARGRPMRACLNPIRDGHQGAPTRTKFLANPAALLSEGIDAVESLLAQLLLIVVEYVVRMLKSDPES